MDEANSLLTFDLNQMDSSHESWIVLYEDKRDRYYLHAKVGGMEKIQQFLNSLVPTNPYPLLGLLTSVYFCRR